LRGSALLRVAFRHLNRQPQERERRRSSCVPHLDKGVGVWCAAGAAAAAAAHHARDACDACGQAALASAPRLHASQASAVPHGCMPERAKAICLTRKPDCCMRTLALCLLEQCWVTMLSGAVHG